MNVSIETGDPRDPAATALLRASHALMQELFPAESNHYLSIDALCRADIQFFVARVDQDIKGCGALKLGDGYGELKSMFVHPSARGLGIAHRLLDHIETKARAHPVACLRLETGVLLQDAHRLYRRHGFSERDAFADYPDDPNSLFMEKML